jgi:zinc/manganese transport system substrate-binding protein
VDPRAAAAIVIALGNRMAELDAGNAVTYRTNATRVSGELTALAQQYSEQFAALSPERRLIVEYHASFSYLNDWLGLTRAASIEPRPGVPPDPGHVTSVRSLMADRGVRAILQETFYPASTARTLASASGAQVVLVSGGVNFSGGETYSEWITSIVSELHNALAGN